MSTRSNSIGGFIHPSQLSPEQRAELLAATHERAARAFTRVGDGRNAEAARLAARIARKAKS